METIYERIRRLRQENNMSQDELAKKTGYTSRSTINKIEAGKIDISRTKIKVFADALGVTPAYLMGWEDESEQGYYTDPEVAEYAEELRTNPELRVLFSSSRNLTKEQMQEAYNFIKFLKMKEENKVHDD
ncbi:MAG: helix-turn-helix transcriptional regulator [Megasphaera micronuciformis]|nr:helix-turn-helix transcriptional regulator [Megasphaera micronuciformis]